MTEGELRALVALHPVLAPHFPAVAQRFYAAVHGDPQTAALIGDGQQVERMQATLIAWMSTGLLGPYDDAFYERRSRIGRRHVEIGLPQHYMFTAMNVVRGAYHELILDAVAGAAGKIAIAAVNKLFDLELAIMVRHYQLDSEARLLDRERHALADRVLAIQTLTAGLAHEVRNPLNAAKLQLELLGRRLGRATTDPRLTEPSRIAGVEIDRLTALVEDFLAFASPPTLRLEEQNISELVRHVCDAERPRATGRAATIELRAPVAPVTGWVDVTKVDQIVSNLVRNAVEAVTENGHVVVEVSGAPDTFTISVQDDGAGMTAEVQARIYEPFFTTKDHGSGLGMSIVHSLVTLHGGSIDLASGAEGTRFEITMPRGSEPRSAA